MAGSSAPLRLRLAEFDRLTAIRGWTTDQARASALGVSRALMSRVRSGELRPGQKFIAGCLAIWGAAGYDLLFETEPERVEPNGEAA